MKHNTALSYLVPIDAPRTGVAVQDALVGMIEKAALGIGDRLPPEVALATTLGVGRSTIREAMNRWEGLGIIRRRRGDGTYLTARVQPSQGPLPMMIKLEGEAPQHHVPIISDNAGIDVLKIKTRQPDVWQLQGWFYLWSIDS